MILLINITMVMATSMVLLLGTRNFLDSRPRNPHHSRKYSPAQYTIKNIYIYIYIFYVYCKSGETCPNWLGFGVSSKMYPTESFWITTPHRFIQPGVVR